jgi:hypothetical protein
VATKPDRRDRFGDEDPRKFITVRPAGSAGDEDQAKAKGKGSSKLKEIPEEQYPKLLGIINLTYSDQATQVVKASVNERGDILAVVLDGIKQLAVKITKTEIFIRLLNPQQEPADLSDPLPGEEAQFAQGTTTVEAFARQLKEKAQPEMARLLADLQDLLASSDSLDEFAAKLDEVYPSMATGGLEAAFAQALTAARKAGMLEAQEE